MVLSLQIVRVQSRRFACFRLLSLSPFTPKLSPPVACFRASNARLSPAVARQSRDGRRLEAKTSETLV
jgi:hypothetical protein